MDISTIKNCIARFAPSRAVLFTGAHGIGKSQFWRDYASEQNQPYIDCRLGQMTEGDLLGLYEIVNNTTVNMPPEWYMQACNEACILHFDELNRALPNVIQGVFQIILDRSLGKYKLHPETRVAASINTGNAYDVVDLDPALLDRFAKIEFSPTIDEFLVWGEKNLHPDVVGFLHENRMHIECRDGVEEGKVTPSRRSWAFFSQDISSDLESREYSFVYHVGRTLVGDEAASAFVSYLEKKKTISVYDVLESYSRGMLEGMTESDFARLSDNVINYIVAKDNLSDKNKANFVKFANDLPNEFVASMWRVVAGSDKAVMIGKLIKDRIQEVF